LERDIESAGRESRQGSGPWPKLAALPLALNLDAPIGPSRESIAACAKNRFDCAEHTSLTLGACHSDNRRNLLSIKARSPFREPRRQCGSPR
jgi:hypothetical protein